ncbi:aminotransferase class IV [Mucilaginibacter arboris]|uniref:branched-chain-amino-acid transaminase n=1 Tax=Mucilaginibacter arboris TaxID=2682090 RepID=A0A7K1SV13_9SPHI|nr:aminotransferase class IV [Mucilaginibacter arboris]MVN20880.1 4-amino-4-deoxychorismate lyase [Mucilaginibacter arboris]
MALLFFNYNGEIIPAEQQVLQLNNRAFRYGDGIFESMRMIKGQLQFASLHAKRLQSGMKALKLENYSALDIDFLKEKAKELATRNKAKNGRMRLTVFRDAGGLYTPTDNKLAYAIEWETLQDQQYTLNQRGLIMNVFEDISKPINSLSNLKTCNSLTYVLAGVHKQRNRLDDAFILNQNGFLCESISSNIFIKYNGTLYTPALSEGCIKGVMRQVVIELALKNSIPVTEAQINPQILNEADEVFLTNATRGIQWVLGFNRKRYFYETSRLLSAKLNEQVNEV